jgi:YgiT-type zinc finger domain-containing protein
MQMKRCPICGGGRTKIKTETTREIDGRSMTLGNVQAYWCPTCTKVSIIQSELLTMSKAELAIGINKLYFTHRYLYYLIGLVILIALVFSTYIFIAT